MGVHARAECVGALVVAASLGRRRRRRPLGNSGTAGPPLHFTINEGPGTLTYADLPYEIDRYRLEGTAAPGAAAGELVVTGEPQRERGSYPLATSVSDYSR